MRRPPGSELDPAAVLGALADAEPTPLWLDDPARPPTEPALVGDTSADLLVVGGGYSGLWAALLAKEDDPGRDVVLLESETVGWAASGRNGGFCAASLTHGFANGVARFEDELATLVRLGRENLDGIETALARYGIDAEFERTGELSVAVAPWQAVELRHEPEAAGRYGIELEWLDAEQVRSEVHSPTYLGAVRDRDCALVHPAKLAWGLKAACLALGVRVHERTPAASLGRDGAGMRVGTTLGSVRAGRVALATNAFPSLLRRVRPYLVPVYDYVLASEPLDAGQLESIGWKSRVGIGDAANQFHYYRLTADQRVVWGGYDAVYHFGNAIRPDLDHRPETFGLLAGHFFETFPQLDGLRFSHAWGGVIDTCSRFCPFWGTAYDGRVGYVAGYTGLGVGATRFGARVLLDLLAGRRNELTSLAYVRSKPMPFPPEPLRWTGIELTRRSLDRADRNEGRRNLWLRALDYAGLGFDS
ncbi:MAG: NAD(P)/FAD-dependent oxidoreductase [Actinomycetes bacterium]